MTITAGKILLPATFRSGLSWIATRTGAEGDGTSVSELIAKAVWRVKPPVKSVRKCNPS